MNVVALWEFYRVQQLSKVQICQTEQKIKESNMTVEKPRLIKQNRYLDFGFGFYTTTNRDQAVNFAQKVTERRKTGKATLNIYSVDENVAFEECSCYDLIIQMRYGWIL